MALARLDKAKQPEPEGCNAMPLTDTAEASFAFLLNGAAEANAIGSWARAAFLPPETFQALLSS